MTLRKGLVNQPVTDYLVARSYGIVAFLIFKLVLE